jgi:hypothetical protein
VLTRETGARDSQAAHQSGDPSGSVIGRAILGQVKGVMFDAATNSVQPISGLCNPSSRQVTWTVGQAGGLRF